MRTFKSIALALVLLVGTSLFAADSVPSKVKKAEATLEIAQLLENPDFELKKDTRAEVTLRVNNYGELVVICVHTENKLVDRYIKSRLNYQKLENTLETGKDYKLPVVITSES